MKSLSVKLGVILAVVGLALFGYADVWGEDWKYFTSGADGTLIFIVKTRYTIPGPFLKSISNNFESEIDSYVGKW